LFDNMKLFLVLAALAAVLVFAAGCSAGPTANTEIQEGTYQKIAASAVKERLDKGEKLIILDVRTREEYDSGHVPNSILLPYDEVGAKASALLPDKKATVIVYCRSGRRSEIAAKDLLAMGYSKVADMGGVNNWTYGLVK